MSIREFYESIKKPKKRDELTQLYSKPKPEINGQMAISQVFSPDTYYQADCLYMPEDQKFKYILVCVDMFDSKVDAEPLKELKPENIIEAFKKMFKRKYLNFPVFITFDKGNEFKGDLIKKYFTSNGTNIKYSLTGRHRQLANVERINQKIATILFKRMTNEELITGENNQQWFSYLPDLIKVLNDPKNHKLHLKKEISDLPIVDKYTGNLLTIGQKVRVLLDYPVNNTNEARLYGKFRSTDTRWTKETFRITEILIKPGFPPMYLVNDGSDVARTKNQLLPISNNIIEPDPKFNRGNSEFRVITGIIDKKIENRKTYYLCKEKGYANPDWYEAKALDRTQDLREMKKEYNETH